MHQWIWTLVRGQGVNIFLRTAESDLLLIASYSVAACSFKRAKQHIKEKNLFHTSNNKMRSFQQGTFAIFAFILILIHVQSFRPSYIQKKSITSLQMINNKGKRFVKFLSISAISFFLNVDVNDMKQVSIISSQPASADSTGKVEYQTIYAKTPKDVCA
jgi:hypothetical protein